ncbi:MULTISPECIES: selenium cofactor biosynthesis protein YqeC [unclassified Romboutsia]|uniref:selenium cofactor biosynthesis protein YqeC n=1 Tax=unclassified Romboutsia TaxID=2626894 RepID=UPI000822E46C|nr:MULTISPECIES: selenium cofactor biosynthesis protein YqeC [unclassified Romboutsia]SCI13321.1 putative selenium-dependent hydroxylase accessory protein YqeC [uncultured Clostridium sp.]
MEIITVVGAGGKTSFIKLLAQKHRKSLRVLSTTTTKIYLPQKESYDKLIMKKSDDEFKFLKDFGVTLAGRYINEENKVVGLNFKEIEEIEVNFDLILIEGDGSKKKKLKGWRDNEPVIYPKSNKVIGIVDITSYDMDINMENIHNLSRFIEISKCKEEKVNLIHLKNMILNENGLFKNSVGEKILFINKVENERYKCLTKELIKLIKKENKYIKILYGSVKENIIMEG